MNPQEKAKQLVEKFRDDPFTSQVTTAGAKHCALICVDEILKIAPHTKVLQRVNKKGFLSMEEYWKQVREAITKL